MLFFANYGYHPELQIKKPSAYKTVAKVSFEKAADVLTEHLRKVHNDMKKSISGDVTADNGMIKRGK